MNLEKLSEFDIEKLTLLGKNVRYIRKNILGIYVKDFCGITGVSRDVVCRLEALSRGNGQMGKGRVYPSISTVFKICDSLNIKIGDILDNDISKNEAAQCNIIKATKGKIKNKNFREV